MLAYQPILLILQPLPHFVFGASPLCIWWCRARILAPMKYSLVVLKQIYTYMLHIVNLYQRKKGEIFLKFTIRQTYVINYKRNFLSTIATWPAKSCTFMDEAMSPSLLITIKYSSLSSFIVARRQLFTIHTRL